MKLIKFSVTNFRSITKAHDIIISDSTILIGKNNEGKSNVLKALNIAMNILEESQYIEHGNSPKNKSLIRRRTVNRRDEFSYNWERDFPISLQTRKQGLKSIFKLGFKFTDSECKDFKKYTGSKLNGDLSVIIKFDRDDNLDIAISKKGVSLNDKLPKIISFIGKRISFNYIPAVRTTEEAMRVVERMLSKRLRELEMNQEYIDALASFKNLQKPVLERLENEIKEPLSAFLPQIKGVEINISEERVMRSMRRELDIIIDDGTPTHLEYKGDGIKSLAALGLLKHRSNAEGASIIAIEEPESHLHPGAIQQLNKIIADLSTQHQVIVTTHNPLFVDRRVIKSNIIIDSGKAKPAKKIKEIRDILGVQISDNLSNAEYVLAVEGDEDVIALQTILPTLSKVIKEHIDKHLFIIQSIGGAGNLSYQLSLLTSQLCTYHVLLDNDDSGRNSYAQAEEKGLISNKQATFTNCKGRANTEFEDCISIGTYKDTVLEKFSVDISSSKFRGGNKWSDRMKTTFEDQGKIWNDKEKMKVKHCVAQCIKSNPQECLHEHNRSSIDALVKSLEVMLSGANDGAATPPVSS